jgi:hypothetical protein
VRSFEAGSLLDSVTMLEAQSAAPSRASGCQVRPGWTRWHRLVTVAPQSPRRAFGPSADHDLGMG